MTLPDPAPILPAPRKSSADEMLRRRIPRGLFHSASMGSSRSVTSIHPRPNTSELDKTRPDIKTMMRIVIVGTNGLAQYIAHFINTMTQHQFIILSRHVSVRPRGKE